MYSETIHKLTSGRWVVAVYDEKNEQYIAPMTDQEKAESGRKAFYAVELDDLGCTSYETMELALEAADIYFEEINRKYYEEFGV